MYIYINALTNQTKHNDKQAATEDNSVSRWSEYIKYMRKKNCSFHEHKIDNLSLFLFSIIMSPNFEFQTYLSMHVCLFKYSSLTIQHYYRC